MRYQSIRFQKAWRGLWPFFCLLPCLLMPCSAHSQGVSITATPMMTEISANSNAQQTGVITLKHEPTGKPGDKQRDPVHVRVYVADWTLDPAGNPLFLKAGASGESCASWIQVNPVEVTIESGAMAQVRYTLSVPPEAQGTYRAMLMFETDTMSAQVRGQKVAINGRLGCALYAQIGPLVRRARITGFALSGARLSLNVENTGTTHLRLKGRIEFQDASGRLLAQMALPGTVLLSGKDNLRVFRVDAPSLPSGVPITMTATLDYGGETLLGARAHVTLP